MYQFLPLDSVWILTRLVRDLTLYFQMMCLHGTKHLARNFG